MWYSAVSKSASLEDYIGEKNDVILCRDEISSLKNNMEMTREHHASMLTRITKSLLKYHTDESS